MPLFFVVFREYFCGICAKTIDEFLKYGFKGAIPELINNNELSL